MATQLLVIHERIGFWARRMRPRLNKPTVRIVETRSARDLEATLANRAFPVVLVDLARRVCGGIDDLNRAMAVAPDAISLVLAPEQNEELRLLARGLGATHVWSGPATPPAVAELLARWLDLSRRRAEASGWDAAAPPPPEPWNWLTPLLDSERTTRNGPRSG